MPERLALDLNLEAPNFSLRKHPFLLRFSPLGTFSEGETDAFAGYPNLSPAPNVCEHLTGSLLKGSRLRGQAQEELPARSSSSRGFVFLLSLLGWFLCFMHMYDI